jgi:hypothetical protein
METMLMNGTTQADAIVGSMYAEAMIEIAREQAEDASVATEERDPMDGAAHAAAMSSLMDNLTLQGPATSIAEQIVPQ